LRIARGREPCPAPPPRRSSELLAPGYRWFTEGFDRPDIKDSKALLDALA